MPHITALRFEHHREPFGIGEAAPRLSWRIGGGDADTAGWYQSAYEVRTSDGWTSGRIEGDESSLVPWPASPLASRERRTVQVRAWDREGRATGWSVPYGVEAGLLSPEEWTAELITTVEHLGEGDPVPAFRREFTVGKDIARARLRVTAHGVYELWLNGSVVGDEVLAPGWTSYHHRLRYRTHDVTDSLTEGPNALGALVAEGWFRGRLGFDGGKRDIWGDRGGLFLQLEIGYADGTTQIVRTDGQWCTAPSAVRGASIYDGEVFDARLSRPGWSAPGFDDSGWGPVRVAALDRTRLVAPDGPPVRRTQLVEPVEILTSPSGRTLVDFGQNLVGRIRIRPKGPAGTEIVLRHAEVLENGELGVRPLRLVKAEDRYICDGSEERRDPAGGRAEWEPSFTFHGFRYAEIGGWPGTLEKGDLTAVVVHSDMERTGWFDSSHPLLDRLHENVVWGMRGNFLDVPTDCPQRDERLGWTGDLQVFAPTASYLYDCSGTLASWLRDVSAEQLASPGRTPPLTVPDPAMGWNMANAAWGDVVTLAPWALYQRFGDLELLARQYEGMTAWVDRVHELAGDDLLWTDRWQLGDWLDPSAPPDRPGDAKTDGHLVATAHFARSARVTALVAGLIGRPEDAERYGKLADEVRAAFAAEYVSPNGRISSDAQTAYALGLRFELLDDAQRARAGSRLAELVHMGGYHIGTGFVGTPLVNDALTDAGEVQLAYRLLLETTCPSFLYPVTMGATTVWERWDSMLPDGSVNPGEMTSFNHYALGAVADWLHRVVAGLAPAAPGYRRITVRPRPGGELTRARSAHETPYGRASVGWTLRDGMFALRVEVPPNTTAEVFLPDGSAPVTVGSGTHEYRVPFTPAAYPPPVPAGLVFPGPPPAAV
ncbi:glycoside hydrolase family 78 protein [Streptomyces paludis]|uniref:glycoside hydrolase family 78 protein n=1 Tax=Streptomyces paludis TaxID=2282738 RepID=UPI001E6112FD|nr:glycoside hydrolase family 78 protein [Streptomyces paludis]